MIQVRTENRHKSDSIKVLFSRLKLLTLGIIISTDGLGAFQNVPIHFRRGEKKTLRTSAVIKKINRAKWKIRLISYSDYPYFVVNFRLNYS